MIGVLDVGREKVGLHPAAREALRILGAQIKIARTQKRWTAEQLAHAAGVSRATVSKTENGDAAVAVGNVLNIASIAGVPLFGVEDRENLSRIRSGREEVLGLIPTRVHPVRGVSDDALDF